MLKIKIITIGKNKEVWLEQALREYEMRLSKFCSIEWILAKNSIQLEAYSTKHSKLIALDPQGNLLNTLESYQWIQRLIIDHDSRLTFVIGGAEGLSSLIKKQAVALWSLSPLTFTHQLTRLILIEQLYRMIEIQKGTSYHK